MEKTAQKHAAAIESSMDGIAIYDRGDTYVYVNQAYAKLNGYDNPDEIVGKTYRLMYNERERGTDGTAPHAGAQEKRHMAR